MEVEIMIINNNLAALNTHRQMGQVSGSAQNSMEKLSSGQRINKGADDAAGLSISEKMRNQIRGLEQAQRNTQDGISLIQTADGALGEVHEILQRVRELTVQAANDTNNTEERTSIKAEINQLAEEITTIKDNTKFNKKALLDGSNPSFIVQNGADKDQIMTMTFSTKGINLTDVQTAIAGVTVASNADATAALEDIDTEIAAVSLGRSTLGAYQNRLEHATNNLAASAENLTAAESRVRDVDMAKEMMEFTKNNILTQASQAMLAQANQQPQAVLQLLR